MYAYTYGGLDGGWQRFERVGIITSIVHFYDLSLLSLFASLISHSYKMIHK